MIRSLFVFIVMWCMAGPLGARETDAWIRINQLGYLPGDIKEAVLIAREEMAVDSFSLIEVKTGRVVYKGTLNGGQVREVPAGKWGMAVAYRLDFSRFTQEGGYRVEVSVSGRGPISSPGFRIGAEVYDGASDFLLNYMRQQRCGDNPFLDAQCHQHDGYIVLHPTRSGEKIDVKGGWHDAADYLQYLTTSANATYQMMFAYDRATDKSVFKDRFDATGRPGANGLPDILDEIRWGLEWLMKMNPQDKVMFNQIADDRDHVGFRLPVNDRADYGWGPDAGRPVYFITGERQGLRTHINRTTGVASSAGKFASAFALGAELFRDIDPAFSAAMEAKAVPAYAFAEEKPGNTQTCCVVSPYFYEEDNYVDDVELAAATFFHLTGDADWLKKADYWGQLEEVTPWLELGRARHYQFYPFVNLGHYYLAVAEDPAVSAKYTGYMRQGLEYLSRRASDCAFLNGVPFMWCSNNLVAAAITQAHLYRTATGDTTYARMEAALRDWLFGCNPWGTSMIVEFPKGSDYPERPHSSYLVAIGKNTPGGLVDGPLLRERHNAHGEYLSMSDGRDAYAPFNNGVALYHDEIWDYATNEPTMDGTASLSYYLSQKELEGKTVAGKQVRNAMGGIIAMDRAKKEIYLVFTADERFNGGETVLKTLKKHKIKASFFLTGNCLRMTEWQELIQDIIKQGHYVGPHGDRHLLYAPWGADVEQSLVSADSLRRDITANLLQLERAGVDPAGVNWFMPSYEHYNSETVRVTASMGMQLINITPGIRTNADYTTPDMASYRSSQELIDQLYDFENKNGLNGAVILIHPGIEDTRTARLYDRLDEILKVLGRKGYSFVRLP